MIGRLHYKRDFNDLRLNGKTIKRGFLSVIFKPADNFSGGIRVAFAVGRSVGGAVVRNRIKRRLREAFSKMITKNKSARVPAAYSTYIIPNKFRSSPH